MQGLLKNLAHRARSVYGVFASPHRVSQTLLVRGLGLVFVVAFWSLASQLEGLIGAHGLSPASDSLAAVKAQHGAWAWLKAPTLFWITGTSSPMLWGTLLLGALAGLAMLTAWVPWWATVLAGTCYLSLMHVGGPWLHFAADKLLVEVALVSLVLSSPRWKRMPAISELAPRPLAVLAMNLLLAKVMFGSGIAKMLSGDSLWQDSTALMVYFETQPLPTVAGWWAHLLPSMLLQRMLWVIMFVELALPFYMVFPRALRAFAGCCFAVHMVLIHVTGNHGFLNLIVLLLALMWIDDRSWSRLLPRQYRHPRPSVKPAVKSSGLRKGGAVLLFALWVPLLLSTTFPHGRVGLPSPWAPLASLAQGAGLCNHYAFAPVVPRMRLGFEVQGTRDGQEWKPYTLRYQPSNPFLPPRYANLHMPRLDQNAWLAAMIALSPEGQPPPLWVRRWMQGLLLDHPATLGLMGDNPFPGQPPTRVRIVLMGQRFADPVSRRRNGRWWNSRLAGLYAEASR